MRKTLSLLLTFALIVSLFAMSGVHAFAAEETAPANKSGVVTTTVDMSKYDKGKVVRVWIPVAQTNEDQTVDNVVFDAPSAAKAELNADDQGNCMLYVEWDADAEPEARVASVSFHASRDAISRPDFVEEGDVPEDLAQYLEPASMIVIDGEVKALADDITKDETSVLGKARAIYDWIIANMNRDNDVKGCGTGDVCTLINTKAGKCTDINSVFVALCRASGIPAREMFGIRMNADDITKNQHCWAQFYLPGTGWVGADPADVLKAVLTNSWDKEQAETKELQEFYWGGNDEKRVELSSGRDIVLNPAQDGEPLNNFGYPYAEVDGEVVDWCVPADFVYSVSFVEDAVVTERTVYVTPEWLNSALNGDVAGYEDVVVVCVAYPGSTDVYTAYGEGHVPGAIYASIMEVEDATGSEEGAYNLLSAEEVRDFLLGHGITADTKVVLYGPDVCGVARQAYGYLWCGVKDVKVLNGGLEAWTAAGFEVETDANALEAAADFGVEVPAHPEYWVSLEEAKDRPASDDNFKLVSIRTEGEWLGETSGYSYMDKAGEPEGAVWGRGGQTAADVLDFCTVDGDAILVNDLDALKAVWADCDFSLDNFLAFYCGTGWRACVPFLVLYENGYNNIAVFDGGWYEILFHDDFPVQVGDPASDSCVHTTVGQLETGKAAA